jgi:hypothetical protein
MDLTDDFQPIVLLADQENFTGRIDGQLVLLSQDEGRGSSRSRQITSSDG